MKTPYEHYQDVSHLESGFNITDKTIMTRLLSYYFEGKVVDWFRTLNPQLVNTWGELWKYIIEIFVEYGDDSTFLILIAYIKRYPHESIDNFNIRFKKNWKSILWRIIPTNAQVLVYYRKDFNPNLNVVIFI